MARFLKVSVVGIDHPHSEVATRYFAEPQERHLNLYEIREVLPAAFPEFDKNGEPIKGKEAARAGALIVRDNVQPPTLDNPIVGETPREFVRRAEALLSKGS